MVDLYGPNFTSTIAFGAVGFYDKRALLLTSSSYGFERCDEDSLCDLPLWTVPLISTTFGDTTEQSMLDD